MYKTFFLKFKIFFLDKMLWMKLCFIILLFADDALSGLQSASSGGSAHVKSGTKPAPHETLFVRTHCVGAFDALLFCDCLFVPFVLDLPRCWLLLWLCALWPWSGWRPLSEIFCYLCNRSAYLQQSTLNPLTTFVFVACQHKAHGHVIKPDLASLTLAHSFACP